MSYEIAIVLAAIWLLPSVAAISSSITGSGLWTCFGMSVFATWFVSYLFK